MSQLTEGVDYYNGSVWRKYLVRNWLTSLIDVRMSQQTAVVD